MFNFFKRFNPLKTGIIGSLVAALCCFTPILVILLGALGAGLADGLSRLRLVPRAVHLFGVNRLRLLSPIKSDKGIRISCGLF
ncbi:MAG: hypothetical protein MZV64_15480 [Ignavibacteriales bacterium]|nr:hypothetical protein [Ignavibacteriales bacterium]